MKKIALFFVLISTLKNLQAQNVGIGTTSPLSSLQVRGDVSMEVLPLTISNNISGLGLTANLTLNKSKNYFVTGPTQDFRFDGFTTGVNGREISLYNSTPFEMKLVNESSLQSNQALRIQTGTKADYSVPSKGTVNLRYDNTELRWVVTSSSVTSSNSQTGGVGYGAWGDCSTRNISEYNPVFTADLVNTDGFGFAVSMSGNFAVISSPKKTIGANTDQGKAYVFQFNGTTWDEKASLTASDGAAGDKFGYAVSISGNTIAIGAPNKTVGANNLQGKVYLFNFNGTTWSQQAIITASDGAAGDNFGTTLSLQGNNLIVGAPNKDRNGFSNEGQAYIYNYNSGLWSLQTTLFETPGANGNSFGVSVSIDGNYAAVATDFGNGVYVYYYNGTVWAQQSFLPFTNYNQTVAISGDNLLVGDMKNSTVVTNGGMVHFYNRTGTNWLLTSSFSPPNVASGSFFGKAVSINGNYALVGTTSLQKAHLLQKQGPRWVLIQTITDPGRTSLLNNYFGNTVTIDGVRFLIGLDNTKGDLPVFGKIEQ